MYSKSQNAHIKKLRGRFNNYLQHLQASTNNPQKRLFIFGLSIITGGFAILTTLLLVYSIFLPSVNSIQNYLGPPSTEMLDVNGKRLYTISDDQIRDIIPISQIPKTVQQATIAIEDDQFYQHHGFDVGGIIKAVFSQIGIGKARGGSTITQQLIKNTFLSSERTITRKIKEVILSTRLERAFEKDEILEMYLNQIPYGGTAYGVEQASDVFFNKDAKDLTLAESAILASLPNAPSYYSPYGNNRNSTLTKEFTAAEADKRKIKDISDLNDEEYIFGLIGQWIDLPNGTKIYLPGRVDTVLKRMENLNYITEAEYKTAVTESNKVQFQANHSSIKAPHFVFYVRDILEQQFGKELVESGGLKVYTSLNLDLQTKAEELISQATETNKQRGATNMSLVSIDNATGHILAMVGSSDYFNEEIDGNVNITTSLKQPGSSFKPFVYAKAFLNRYGPGTVIWDVRTAFGPNYPNNYDGHFIGPTSIRYALGQSRNIPAIKAFYLAGEEKGVIDLATKMGITTLKSNYDYGYPLALGSGEIQQLELTHAYSAFGLNGKQAPLTPILKVEDSKGNILYEAPKEIKYQDVLDKQASYLISNILSDHEVNLGSNLELSDRPAAVKTGTSNKKIDANKILPSNTWTIGYTPQLTTSVWSGNSNGDAMRANASGYSNAAPTWKKYMEYANKTLEIKPTEFTKPEEIKSVAISKISGLLPGKNTPKSMIRTDLFASYAVPKEVDNSFTSATVDIRNGLLPNEYCPNEFVQTATFITPHSVIPGFLNWEEAIYAWLNRPKDDKNTLVEGNIFYRTPPREESDLCSKDAAKNRPEISITSPVNFSALDYGTSTVTVSYSAPNGIDRIEYSMDTAIQYTATSGTYDGNIRVTRNLQPGSTHNVIAKVIDKQGYSNTATITVKIGTSNTPPITEPVPDPTPVPEPLPFEDPVITPATTKPVLPESAPIINLAQ